MNFFWVDGNAGVKRYITEDGTPRINYFFDQVPLSRMFFLFDGAGEVISVFVRRYNDKTITATRFSEIRQQFETEFIRRDEVVLISPTANQITDSWDLIEAHSVNCTDAIILQCALDQANVLLPRGDGLVLVSSDQRLLDAARREGLLTFNAEIDSQEVLDVLINQ